MITPAQAAEIRHLAANLPPAPKRGLCHCGRPVKGHGLEMCEEHSDQCWGYYLAQEIIS